MFRTLTWNESITEDANLESLSRRIYVECHIKDQSQCISTDNGSMGACNSNSFDRMRTYVEESRRVHLWLLQI